MDGWAQFGSSHLCTNLEAASTQGKTEECTGLRRNIETRRCEWSLPDGVDPDSIIQIAEFQNDFDSQLIQLEPRSTSVRPKDVDLVLRGQITLRIWTLVEGRLSISTEYVCFVR